MNLDFLKRLCLVGLFIISASINVNAQEISSEEENEDDSELFFEDVNTERFGSTIGNSEGDNTNSNSYDFKRKKSGLNIFENKSSDFQKFQYQGDEKETQYLNNNKLSIGSDGGNNSQVAPGKADNSTFHPSVKNPYAVNPTVKAPRNMDAVPDNGDDPSDIPLDGGIVILGLTAAAFGIKKKVLGNK
jgi:hypothetical protein